jgi:hypothetical protein
MIFVTVGLARTEGDQKVIGYGMVGMRVLELNCFLNLLFLYFQCIMDFTEAARVCVLLLRIREVRLKKKYWAHSIVSQTLLNENCINYFRI